MKAYFRVRLWYSSLDIFTGKISKAWFPYRRKWRGRIPVSGSAMLLGRLRWYGNAFWWCRRRPHSIANVPVETRKVQLSSTQFNSVQLSSTFENVPDALLSCPRRCWDVPVAYNDMDTRLKIYCMLCIYLLHMFYGISFSCINCIWAIVL